MKTERLEAQSRRDNLRFYGFDDKFDESWDESETRVKVESRLNTCTKIWSLIYEEGLIQYRQT